MGSRRKSNRTGLLAMKKHRTFCITLTVFILMFSPSIHAQDIDIEDAEEKFPYVYISTYPQTLVIGVPWTLTLLIDHEVPNEVTVIAPLFEDSLIQDRMVKIPRMTDSRLQTAVEYRFVTNNPGRYILEPFTVITPVSIIETEPYILEIQGPATEQRPLAVRAVWEGSPGIMESGQRAIIALRVTGRNINLPVREFFMPQVPRGAILEPLQLTAEDTARGVVIKLNLIPLDGDFSIPARVLHHENTAFEIPALNIRVREAGERQPNVIQSVIDESKEISDNVHVPFPEFNPGQSDILFFEKFILDKVWYSQCEIIYNNARELWENGFYAQALANLRQNERDHPAGALLKQIRREAEENLNFFNTENENRWRRKLLLGLSFLVFFLVIIVPFVCFNFVRKSFRKKAALLCAVVFAIAVLSYIYVFLDSRNVFSGEKNEFGVTNETPVRRTADFDGEKLFSFRKGQPVVIMLNSGTWVFVRANDSIGSSGWIPAEEVIFY